MSGRRRLRPSDPALHIHAHDCIFLRMRVGIAGASGYAGAELLRLCAGPSRARGGRGRGRHPGRASPWRRCTRRWRPPTRLSSSPRPGPTSSPVSTWSSWPCRTASPRTLAPGLVDRVGLLVDLSADFRLRDAGGLPALVRPRPRGARAARRVRLRASRAVPRRARRGPAGGGAGVLPDGGGPGPGPAGAGGRHRDHRRHRGRGQRRVGGGAQARRTPRTSTPPTRTSPPTGSCNHRHTPEIEQAVGGPGALHAAPGPDEPGHPGHLLRAPRRGPRPPTTSSGSSASRLRRRALRGGERGVALDQGDLRVELPPI